LGHRANFSSCDLSGLDLGANNPNQVVLPGADFTEADLGGIQGSGINFHHVSLHGANLSPSHLKAQYLLAPISAALTRGFGAPRIGGLLLKC
jgi:uncharacterized protein YjbI with pentapeptide repeats